MVSIIVIGGGRPVAGIILKEWGNEVDGTWVGLPHSFICTRQAVQNRCSAYSPCTSKAARRHSNFLDLHASVSTLSTSSTAVCVSGPLQLYSSSRSLHPSGGTCLQPLPSCMCTGGVVRSFTSRLDQPLSAWAHRHFTAVMYHPSASQSLF